MKIEISGYMFGPADGKGKIPQSRLAFSGGYRQEGNSSPEAQTFFPAGTLLEGAVAQALRLAVSEGAFVRISIEVISRQQL